MTTQGVYTGLHPGDRKAAQILAFDGDGDLIYENQTHDAYFDVDPVPGSSFTVEYVASRRLGPDACDVDDCSLNFVERLNLSTGEVTRIYENVTNQYDTGRWHDVDRIDSTHLAVADIVDDRVYVVDTRTDEIVWQWRATEEYTSEQGGPPADWTHVNDVEILHDGRMMVSLRNMDSVIFIDPVGGVDASWTIGSDDDHDTLFEQHNPDYVPTERGGPAVIVADSENNRIVEYRREGTNWTASWSWRDAKIQWPRDADRLEDGHTLIADSHGDRVVEIDTSGTVVWSVDVDMPYEVERLGSGDESATGYAAGTAPTDNATGGGPVRAPPAVHQRGSDSGAVLLLKDALPIKFLNGLLFVSPAWVTITDLLTAFTSLVVSLAWGILEWRWRRYPIPNALRRVRSIRSD